MALVGRKLTVVRDQLFPQKPPGSRFRFSRTGVQPSPGSSTIELPSAFAESGIKCQSRLWSQRGTKDNGSHLGDNPLVRPTGVQIASKRYATLQTMAPINITTVHQTSLLHIESSLDRLGWFSPTHDQRSQQQSGQITLLPVLINNFKFVKATHHTKIRNFEIPRSMVVEALSWWNRRASQHPVVQSPVHS